MTKRIFALIAALLLIALPALAAPSGQSLVVDDAHLLTDAGVEELTKKAERISQEYGMDVAIMTAHSTGGKTPEAFADDFYDTHGYAPDGVMLVLAMEERDWWITTAGEGIRAFTDYGIRRIGDDIVEYLSEGDYYGGFDRYLDDAETFLHRAAEGEPYDVGNEYDGVPLSTGQKLTGSLPVAGVLSAIITALGMGKMKRGLHTVHKQRNATRYASHDGLRLTRQQDLFLYHTQIRQRLPEPDRNSGGGGSSTHVSSSGVTHGGGGGKF